MAGQHPWKGLTAALGTQHGKGRALALPFSSCLGISVEEVLVDTDALGTFTGEIDRRASALEAAITKAKLAMAATGAPLGLGSEGSYGPDPGLIFVPSGEEVVALVEARTNRVIHASIRTFRTNVSSVEVNPSTDLLPLLRRIGLPDHAAIVRSKSGSGPIFKGLTAESEVRNAILRCASASRDGIALLEADMRAHVNPTRMRAIRLAARALVKRVAARCSHCAAPGFAETGLERGLPCGNCGTPTVRPRAHLFRCDACGHQERKDVVGTADPSRCALCNP